MREAHTPDEVVSALRELGAQRIAVDGTDGSGKSTLALDLSVKLGLNVVHLDDFVSKNLGAYIENLDTARLTEALASSQTYVIEGVCLLRALELISVEPDAIVYVKLMSHGLWSDEDELAPNVAIDDHLTELRARFQPMAEFSGEAIPLGALSEEIIRYHAAYRPFERASIAYHRVDA